MAPPTSWQVTFQLVPWLQREDATTSYLTSSPRLPPFPPSSLQVDTGPQPLRLTVSPTATLGDTAPMATARTHRKSQIWAHSSSGQDVLGWGGGRIRGAKWLKSQSVGVKNKFALLLYLSQHLITFFFYDGIYPTLVHKYVYFLLHAKEERAYQLIEILLKVIHLFIFFVACILYREFIIEYSVSESNVSSVFSIQRKIADCS